MGRKKSPKSKKPRQLTWRDKAQLGAVLLALMAAGVFGAATAFSKRSYVHTGTIAEVDEAGATLRLDGPDGEQRLSLRYDEDTKFLEADRRVVPSSKLVGLRAQIHYKKSLFVEDHAIAIELIK